MKKIPDLISHMIQWGIVIGFFVMLGYMSLAWYVLSSAPAGMPIVMSPICFLFPFVIGVIPGGIVGCIIAFSLWFQIRHFELPFTTDDMKQHNPQIYITTFILTYTLTLAIIFAYLQVGYVNFYNDYLHPVFVWGLLPIFITVFFVFATHRYLQRLHNWSLQFDPRKSKLKNDTIPLWEDLDDSVIADIAGERKKAAREENS